MLTVLLPRPLSALVCACLLLGAPPAAAPLLASAVPGAVPEDDALPEPQVAGADVTGPEIVVGSDEATLVLEADLATAWRLALTTLGAGSALIDSAPLGETWVAVHDAWLRVEPLLFRDGTWMLVRLRIGAFAAESEKERARALLESVASQHAGEQAESRRAAAGRSEAWATGSTMRSTTGSNTGAWSDADWYAPAPLWMPVLPAWWLGTDAVGWGWWAYPQVVYVERHAWPWWDDPWCDPWPTTWSSPWSDPWGCSSGGAYFGWSHGGCQLSCCVDPGPPCADDPPAKESPYCGTGTVFPVDPGDAGQVTPGTPIKPLNPRIAGFGDGRDRSGDARDDSRGTPPLIVAGGAVAGRRGKSVVLPSLPPSRAPRSATPMAGSPTGQVQPHQRPPWVVGPALRPPLGTPGLPGTRSSRGAFQPVPSGPGPGAGSASGPSSGPGWSSRGPSFGGGGGAGPASPPSAGRTPGLAPRAPAPRPAAQVPVQPGRGPGLGGAQAPRPSVGSRSPAPSPRPAAGPAPGRSSEGGGARPAGGRGGRSPRGEG